MKDFKENGKVIEITLESGKVVKVSKKWVDNTMATLNTDIEDVLLMWLEDNDYLVNIEQEELDKQAKGVVKTLVKSETPKKKTPRERVLKENPTKELIIQTIAKSLESLAISNLNIENKAKLITFSMNNEDFKIDLVQKRKPKVKNE